MSGAGPTLRVGPVAHGGHCVARHEGRVVFVRHALPGELVRVALTDARPEARFWRADAVEVLEPSSDRVPSPWPEAGPGGVGGGELGHVALPAQRAWKAAVVAEQLRRIAGLDLAVSVEAAPGEADGLGWRTRLELVADAEGRAGMHRYRSHDVLALAAMPLATAEMDVDALLARRWPPGSRITAVAPVGGDRPLVLVDGGAVGRVRPRSQTHGSHLGARAGDGGRARARVAGGRDRLLAGAPGGADRARRRRARTPWANDPGRGCSTCTRAPGCSRRRWPTWWARPAGWTPSRATRRRCATPGATCTTGRG